MDKMKNEIEAQGVEKLMISYAIVAPLFSKGF